MVKIGNIKSAVVQRVGNKSNEDGVSFSDEVCQMESVEEPFLKLINSSFKFNDWKQFYFIDDLELNPTYRFVTKIFADDTCIVQQANNLARHLYEQSIHPNIKIGEFYVVLLNNCEVDGKQTSALGLFKSEVRETVLTIRRENNRLVLSPEMGMSLKKLEKGCIVFNVDKENGYKVAVVDNTGNDTDAHYWVDNFLHVRNCNDDFHQTERLLDMCTGFVKQLKEQSDFESAIIAKRTANILSADDVLQIDNLPDLICQNEEQKADFITYRQNYEEEYGCFDQEVNIVKKATVSKPVKRMNTMRLGSDFEVRVLNPEAEIASGIDNNSGNKYITLFYNG